ncbi:hypothetical protein R80B4_00396 [Fibrobacteres bacterium R8-0-B4]
MNKIKNILMILCLTVPSLSRDMQLYINETKKSGTRCIESCIEHDGNSSTKRYYCTEEEMVTLERVYECVEGETIRKKIILKNAKIDLESVVIDINKYLPKDARYHSILKNNMNGIFLNEINKMKLVTEDIVYKFCYNINIYDGKNLLISFGTNGHYLYDRKNKLMYVLEEYDPENNLLQKYWGIWEENHCR